MPRRYVLDEILVNAAIAAGAEFRPAFTVTGLVARAVEAPVVREYPVVTFGYYSYFSGVPVGGVEGWMTPETSLHLMFPTNDELTCVAIQGPSPPDVLRAGGRRPQR